MRRPRRGDTNSGTDKDLDLFFEAPSGRVVGSGEKTQILGDREPTDDESRNPRERVVLTNLAACPVVADPEYAYRIRVRARHGRFDATDRLRILVTAARERRNFKPVFSMSEPFSNSTVQGPQSLEWARFALARWLDNIDPG